MSQIKSHRIVVVTPAGRKRYLEIMSKYILKDAFIDEWHLWDNCRENSDREYINQLSAHSKKIKVIEETNTDGTNRSVNKFYKYARDVDTFYIKMDDDIVYLPEDFSYSLYAKALKEKEKYSWWSPMVINNAICTYLLNAQNIISTNASLTAQASCPMAWKSPQFAEALHNLFLDSLKSSGSMKWRINNSFELFLQRFSINTIGFWGDFSRELGDKFCPLNVDDEEYISAKLPILTNRPGRLIGDILVAHFSFFTQEAFLLSRTNILQTYAMIAGINNYKFSYQIKNSMSDHLKHLIIYDGKYFLNHILNIYPSREKVELKLNLE